MKAIHIKDIENSNKNKNLIIVRSEGKELNEDELMSLHLRQIIKLCEDFTIVNIDEDSYGNKVLSSTVVLDDECYKRTPFK